MSDDMEIGDIVSDLTCYVSHALSHRTMHMEDGDRVYTECHLGLAADVLSTALYMIDRKDWASVLKAVCNNAKELAASIEEMLAEEELVDNSHMH